MSASTEEQVSTAALHRKMDIELAKLLAEISKINAEVSNITAETSRLNREAATYPWLPVLTTVLGSTGLIGAIVAIIVAFHR